MSSLSQITERKRVLKKRKMGRKRKNLNQKKGSTPPFPIHPEKKK